ncbi:hypothetical protein Q0F99_19090 [Rathayibacter oskolensis]|uniref:hypothetical protein n=1 Tax=Rathayibacter oskolensis TaxID=1891671 RepID=UPI0026600401|nr:hypothetical protein [Rathayibacter oskolensis]WKK71446.1 hypothetical protein Q0F99_19090 [Rathayibacter oskolensis]
MGINYDLVAKQGQTVAARWDQLTDKLKMMAGQATKPLFDRVSKELDNISGFDYQGTGANLERIVQGAIDGFDNAVSFAKTVVETIRSVPAAIQQAFETATDWIGARFRDAARLGADALDYFRERAEDARKKLEEFKGWVEQNETAIRTVATVLGVVFGPALVRAAVIATIQGAKIAASGVAAGAGWVSGAIASAIAWSVQTARIAAFSFLLSAMLIKDAIKAGAAWVAGAVTSSVGWTLHFAKMLVVSAGTSILMAVHAADVGWAWVINGTRAAFAWVTTSLPRIVAAMALTSASASMHALGVSAVWVASAARSATAWVVVELPRIIMSFLATSASAASNALFASAAWVAAATKSGIAWVVTELPRIIGAFVSMAGAAVIQAAIASGAWIASAVASSGAITALSALAATPMVLPALVIVAALASIAAVKTAHDEMSRAIQGQEKANQDSLEVTRTAMKRNLEVQSSGVYSAETKERFNTATNNIIGINQKKAIGTNFAAGDRPSSASTVQSW